MRKETRQTKEYKDMEFRGKREKIGRKGIVVRDGNDRQKKRQEGKGKQGRKKKGRQEGGKGQIVKKEG